MSLCVRRQALGGDPDGDPWTGPSQADLQNADGTFVEYLGVKPYGPSNVHHGYRVGDSVLVTRRGRYFFCDCTGQVFIAKIHGGGPLGEDDF